MLGGAVVGVIVVVVIAPVVVGGGAADEVEAGNADDTGAVVLVSALVWSVWLRPRCVRMGAKGLGVEVAEVELEVEVLEERAVRSSLAFPVEQKRGREY